MDEAELLKRLMAAFKQEAEEHINSIISGLIELEKNPGEEKKKKILEEIYRAAHSMKGAARAVNLTDIEKLFQALEGCLSLMKKDELKPSSKSLDHFHSVLNTVEVMLDDSKDNPESETIQNYIDLLSTIESVNDDDAEKPREKTMDEGKTSEKQETISTPVQKSENKKQPDEKSNEEKKPEVINNQENTEPENVDDTSPEETKEKEIGPIHSDNVRLSSKKIDEIYLLAEESLQLKLSHSQEQKDIAELTDELLILKSKWLYAFTQLKKLLGGENEKNRISAATTLNKKNAAEQFETINEQIKIIEKKIAQLNRSSKFVSFSMQNTLDNLVDEVKNILMLPFSNLFDSFPRIVRELAKDMKKEIEINISGATIEVDRRIMEELKDPLIHIIRNCIDHGIEKPDTRVSAGKNKKGKIEINIVQTDARHVQIEIQDDGAGISVDKVKKKALSDNVISQTEMQKLSDNEIKNLIFKSGMSTSNIITDISGRGLGLAIVEENIEKLGGKVQLESEENKGTKFSIKIPTSVSKSQGLLVHLNNKPYIFPGAGILETLRVKKENTKRVENKNTIQYNNRTLPLVKLTDVLQIAAGSDETGKYLNIVVIESKNQRIGFIVDKLVDEQEVLFKKPGYPLSKIRNISGVSLLGTGDICPVLNNQDLIKSAHQTTLSGDSADAKNGEKQKQKSIILAEDSITSRLFLKNVLESAGYKIKTTVDGKEAFTALKQNKYDLLISDVEMPRMNGFELTESVRKDKTLADIPVILVTSLSKREDQERGIEAGANAYIIKSSFEQSNLLEVVNRLI